MTILSKDCYQTLMLLLLESMGASLSITLTQSLSSVHGVPCQKQEA